MDRFYAYILTESMEELTGLQAVRDFKEYVIPAEHFYLDSLAEHRRKRPGFERMMKVLTPGDVVFLRDFSDLGRDFGEMCDHWMQLTGEKLVDVVMVSTPVVDTRSRSAAGKAETAGDITGALFEYLQERCEKRQGVNPWRQAQRPKVYKKRGRKPMELPKGFEEGCQEYEDGNISQLKISQRLGVDRKTFMKYYTVWKEGKQ